MKKHVNIGLLGLGNVGQGVCEVLAHNKKIIQTRTNCDFLIKKAVVKSTLKKRSPFTEGIKLDTNYQFVTEDPNIDIVVELLTDKTLAFNALKSSLQHKKGFVTANKAMIAEYGHETWPILNRHKKSIGFEASVGGALPIVRTLKAGLRSEKISLIAAIINGTANYILTEMSQKKISFEQALKTATAAGYAEADPSLDINGSDTAHKICIMANLGFGGYFPYKKIHKLGIDKLSQKDILWANNFGYTIKLLGIAKKSNTLKNSFIIAAKPTMIKNTSILADVNGVYNAALIRGDFLGDALIYGKGAGDKPTAISVLADIIEVADNITEKNENMLEYQYSTLKDADAVDIVDIGQCEYENYIRVSVQDKVGVLSKLANIVRQNNVSISQIVQKPPSHISDHKKSEDTVDLVVITHHAMVGSVNKIISEIVKQPFYAGEYCHLYIDNSL